MRISKLTWYRFLTLEHLVESSFLNTYQDNGELKTFEIHSPGEEKKCKPNGLNGSVLSLLDGSTDFLDNPLESLLNHSSSALMWVRIKPPSHHQVFRGLIRIQRCSQMHFSNFSSVISALGYWSQGNPWDGHWAKRSQFFSGYTELPKNSSQESRVKCPADPGWCHNSWRTKLVGRKVTVEASRTSWHTKSGRSHGGICKE